MEILIFSALFRENNLNEKLWNFFTIFYFFLNCVIFADFADFD